MHRSILLLCLVALPALGLLTSCGDDAAVDGPALWSPTTEAELTLVQKQQRKQAFGAKDAMFKQLSKALVAAMKAGGPPAAIEVCRTQAPGVAERVSKDREVRIGRTAFKLRNPANRPPAWAVDLVARQEAKNAYVLHADGRFGALLPIRLQNACLTCHGDPDTIAPEVKTVLAKHYPADEATGFATGDLRGWFWIEVPAVRTAPASDEPAR